jgi:L-lactate utilization protein LutB
MDQAIENFWKIRLQQLKNALEANNFTVFLADNTDDARRIFVDTILPDTGAASVSWGGSVTAAHAGVCEALKQRENLQVIDAFEKGISLEESWDRRRRAFLVDLYLTGANAITEAGQLVNLDRTGNRVAALTFGPKKVVLFAGRNKITPNLEGAFARVKSFAAPINAIRLQYKTPCAKTAACQECSGAERLCNTWTITEKSFPKGRITVVLINQDLGF